MCKIIWDELGEPDSHKDAMLLEIEQKCLDLYRKKVDEAKQYRAQLQHEIADYEAEIAGICAAMGEQPLQVSLVGSLKLSLFGFSCKHKFGFKNTSAQKELYS